MADWQHTEYGERVLEEMRRKLEAAEKTHKLYRPRWDEIYTEYRSFKAWDNWRKTNESDRDAGLEYAGREWGANLQIPVAFWTVETILPRALSNRPRMLILPRDRKSAANVDNMRLTIDSQQERIDYELKAAEAAKNGFILGLGITKPFWRTHKRKSYRLQRPSMPQEGGPEWIKDPYEDVVFDDPDVDVPDPYDWMWSPQATGMDDLEYCFHRTWRSSAYVWRKIKEGVWKPELVKALDPEDIEGSAPSSENYDSLWAKRLEAMGFNAGQIQGDRGRQLHEVLEFHDGERVITIVDRLLVVNCGENPFWHGQIPFSLFRPTTAGTKQLPGIGEIEPICHLAQELSTLRGQRRDAATFALMPPLFGDSGQMDPQKIIWAPGQFNPVDGNPNEILWQPNIRDVPASGYQEEDRILANIETATGIGEPVTGGSEGSSETATGVQLTVAAASIRIQAKTHRLEVELIKNDADLFIEMNQQMIMDKREMRKPGPPNPAVDPEQRWEWFDVGPEELAGKMYALPEGGSTAPENIAQMRADAQAIWAVCGNNPNFDQKKVALYVLEQFSVRSPQQWVVDQSQLPPKETWNALAQMLSQNQILPPEQIDQFIQAVQQTAVQMEGQQQQQGGAQPNQEGQPGAGAQQSGSYPEKQQEAA